MQHPLTSYLSLDEVKILMIPPSPHQITALLRAWRAGDQLALEQLLPLVERELYRLAEHHMRGEKAGHTLQTTALINEAYLRLANQQGLEWKDRTHFFAAVSQVMRHVLVDYARRHGRDKRGGGALQVPLNEVAVMSIERSAELIALDEALEQLAMLDARQARVVELRYFSGLTVEETAEVLKISPITVMREWRTAKAWLRRELNNGSEQ